MRRNSRNICKTTTVFVAALTDSSSRGAKPRRRADGTRAARPSRRATASLRAGARPSRALRRLETDMRRRARARLHRNSTQTRCTAMVVCVLVSNERARKNKARNCRNTHDRLTGCANGDCGNAKTIMHTAPSGGTKADLSDPTKIDKSDNTLRKQRQRLHRTKTKPTPSAKTAQSSQTNAQQRDSKLRPTHPLHKCRQTGRNANDFQTPIDLIRTSTSSICNLEPTHRLFESIARAQRPTLEEVRYESV